MANETDREIQLEPTKLDHEVERPMTLMERANAQNAIDAERAGYGKDIRAYILSLGATWH